MLLRMADRTNPPRIAVVIPAWGRYAEAPLREALASVAAQSVPVELVVVDNASDVPLSVPPGVRVVRSTERVSVGAARNLGLAHVSAPLVIFLDADDVLLLDGLTRLVDGIDAFPAALAYAGLLVDGQTGGIHRVPRRSARVLARWPTLFAAANSVWSLFPLQGSTVLRTDAVRRAGGYGDADHGEDWALGAIVAWRGPIALGGEPVLEYRWRADSLGRRSPTGLLARNARAVRERLSQDPYVPAWYGGHALAALQWLALYLVRPLARGLRTLR
jgi:glycosyltransferase involved in cell wall biosynthesis